MPPRPAGLGARLRPSARRALAGLAAALLALAPTAPGRAQPSLTEAQAKAAFVLNIARYVEWPAAAFATAESPLRVCLANPEPLGPALAALQGRLVQGRPLQLRQGLAADAGRDCHVLFTGESDPRRELPLLRGVAGAPVLTISDSERFIELGGAVGLVLVDQRLQFEVNRGALDQARLKAGASLLRLARKVN